MNSVVRFNSNTTFYSTKVNAVSVSSDTSEVEVIGNKDYLAITKKALIELDTKDEDKDFSLTMYIALASDVISNYTNPATLFMVFGTSNYEVGLNCTITLSGTPKALYIKRIDDVVTIMYGDTTVGIFSNMKGIPKAVRIDNINADSAYDARLLIGDVFYSSDSTDIRGGLPDQQENP